MSGSTIPTEEGPRLWWRDDDAVAATPALEQLLDTADTVGIVPVLAVIPAHLDESLPRMLQGRKVHVALHGWQHHNHQPKGSKKAELGDARPSDLVLGELHDGVRRLQDAFGDQFLPLLVPPWNRSVAAVEAGISQLGLQALSRFNGDRPWTSGVPRIDTHLDLIDWKGDRGFIGHPVAESVLRSLLDRNEMGGRTSLVGVLSHHLVEVAESAWFMRSLADILADLRPSWLSGQEILAAAQMPGPVGNREN